MLAAPLAALAVALAAAAARDAARAVAARRARGRLAPSVAPRRPPSLLLRAVEDAAVPWRPEHVWLAWMGGVTLAATSGAVAAGLAAGILLGAAAAVAPAGLLHALRGRADAQLERSLPDALELLARSLRTGATPRGALCDAAAATGGRLGGDLRRVVAAVEGGMPLTAALDEWAAARPLPGVRLAVAALALGAESGGAMARAVDGVAATLRAGQAVAAEARSLASQARLSALVIALAPLGFTALAAGADPRALDFLLRTPVGLACLAGGLLLDAVAAAWMHRLTAVVA